MSHDSNATARFDVFCAGAAGHPARQAWLVHEVGQWFADDLKTDQAKEAVVSQALKAAGEGAHRWLDERFEADDVVRVDLRLSGHGRERHSVFRSVPSPLALLLICLDQCRVGDEVVLSQELAKAGRVETRGEWPFGMGEAEKLTRPARIPEPA